MLKLSKFPFKVYYIPKPKVVLKPKVYFVGELISKILEAKKVLSISDVINMSQNMIDFKENLSVFTKENIESTEKLTKGQSENEHWFEFTNA